MNGRLLAPSGTVLLLLAVCIRCDGQSQKAGVDRESPVCGDLLVWDFPDQLLIDSTATEGRHASTLLTQARINLIVSAATSYCLQFGEYPSTYGEMLQHATELPAEMDACKLQGDLLDDWWGRPIYYSREANGIRVESSGADGRFTTDDDIGLPKSGDLHVAPVDIADECVAITR